MNSKKKDQPQSLFVNRKGSRMEWVIMDNLSFSFFEKPQTKSIEKFICPNNFPGETIKFGCCSVEDQKEKNSAVSIHQFFSDQKCTKGIKLQRKSRIFAINIK